MSVSGRNMTFEIDFEHMMYHGYTNEMHKWPNGSTWAYANSMFVGALVGSIASKSSAIDIWGNVKIPRIELYEDSYAMNDEGWFVTSSSNPNSYTSMVGIPLRIRDREGRNTSKAAVYETRIQVPYLRTMCIM